MLLLDCGNTALKCQFEHQQNTFYLDDKQFDEKLTEFINNIHPNTSTVLSSVASQQIEDNIKHILNQYFNNPVTVAVSESNFGTLTAGYQDINQLGVDRWLAMIATHHLKMNHIIIDAGSWIKMDAVLANGQHLGGIIISKSKHDEETLFNRFDLKDSSCNQQNIMFGTSTQQCLCLSSNNYGLTAMNQSLTQWLPALGESCQIIIGGGDAHDVLNAIQQLDKSILNHIFDIQQNENLVLSGLSTRYNC